MTLLHSPDDEILSAYLDGAGDESDARHIESCAACQARLAELRAVATKVGSPVAGPDPERRERAIAAALAAGASAGRRRVIALGQRLRHPLVPLVIVLIALVALLAVLISGTNPSDDIDPAGTEEIITGDLGTIEDEGQLAERLEAGLESGRARAALGGQDDETAVTAEDVPCEAQARALAPGTQTAPLLSALLEWGGEPAAVHVYETGGSAGFTRQAVVLAAADCRRLAGRRF